MYYWAVLREAIYRDGIRKFVEMQRQRQMWFENRRQVQFIQTTHDCLSRLTQMTESLQRGMAGVRARGPLGATHNGSPTRWAFHANS